MPFYRNHVYPHLVSLLGNPKPIREIRQRIVPLAEGKVLELGVGPGPNFIHYDPERVRKLYALEPNPGMVRLAQQRQGQTKLDIEYLDLPGERIPLDDGAVDTVVSTFTFCTIPGILQGIRGIGRVLRSSGRLIFFEHGLSPDPRVRRWQKRWEPVLYRVFAGCHVTRDIPALIQEGGFQIEKMESGYLTRFPKSLAYCWWGVAVPKPR